MKIAVMTEKKKKIKEPKKVKIIQKYIVVLVGLPEVSQKL
jgi:hypothetical protein